MLRISGLSKYYGHQRGIENVNVTVKKGEILGVLGQNGSGKTTLFRVLLSLIQPSSGHFAIDLEHRSRQLVFGYLPEERAMYMDITVYEQIIYLGRLRKMKKKKIESQLTRWLSFFDMSDQRHRLIKELSKGNQQKVQFIAAVIHDPDILILDEPMTGLDGINLHQLKKAISLMSKLGKVILLSSHQYEEMEQFCHTILLLNSGEVKLSGNLRELKEADARWTLTVNNDRSLAYKEREGVLLCEHVGEYSRYTFESVAAAQAVCTEMMKNKNLGYLRLEMISLRDLVIEAT